MLSFFRNSGPVIFHLVEVHMYILHFAFRPSTVPNIVCLYRRESLHRTPPSTLREHGSDYGYIPTLRARCAFSWASPVALSSWGRAFSLDCPLKIVQTNLSRFMVGWGDRFS